MKVPLNMFELDTFYKLTESEFNLFLIDFI